ncbi:MAG: hypothetical protein IPO27_10460 [Bacteroidetes bacterium]|nr:hypothetical protein [Bacteroidota bacterium]
MKSNQITFNLIKAAAAMCVIIIISACENNAALLSEDKIKGYLEKSWRPLAATSNYGTSVAGQPIYWSFAGGSLKEEYISTDTFYARDYATYTIDAKTENPTIKIEGFTSSSLDTTFGFNIVWTIINIDDNVLDIAGNSTSGGLVELEFTAK